MVTFSLPFALNSGQYLCTGSCSDNSPLSASSRRVRNIIVFVLDHTLVMVSRSHGAVRSISA